MINLTDRQRFALRESLCLEIEDRCASAGYPWHIYPEKAAELRNWVNGHCDTDIDLYAGLLGEWPVGFRGDGGWEPIEVTND